MGECVCSSRVTWGRGTKVKKTAIISLSPSKK
jgi:hypothetical protein